jgi:ankyrin repeat protein
VGLDTLVLTIAIRTPRSLAAAPRPRRKRERKAARLLDSGPHLSSQWILYLEIVKLLLERGADMHAMNSDDETPYQLSLQKGKRNIADLLWEHGAGTSRSRLD